MQIFVTALLQQPEVETIWTMHDAWIKAGQYILTEAQGLAEKKWGSGVCRHTDGAWNTVLSQKSQSRKTVGYQVWFIGNAQDMKSIETGETDS